MNANNSPAAIAKQTPSIRARVDPKALIAALKATQEFVSEDPTRYVLQNVYVKASSNGKQLRFVATDGHTLCYVDIEAEIEIKGPGEVLLSGDAITALIAEARKSKYEAEAFTLTNSLDGTFPEYLRVVPSQVNTGKSEASRVVGFNGLYLARIGHVQKSLKAGFARVQFGADGYSALRADIKSDLGEATVVVMPVRL